MSAVPVLEIVGKATPTVVFGAIADEAAADIGGQVDALAALGWSAIELRTVDGVPVAHLDERAFSRVAETVARRQVTVCCVASEIANWQRPITGDFTLDLDELEILSRRCAVLGAQYVRIMSYPNAGLDADAWGARATDRIRRLVARAEKAGLVLLHENCAGWAATDAERMLTLIEAVDSPALRLLFDTGNGVAHGYDACDLLSRIVDHVAHVHVKDATRRSGAVRYTVPGNGFARVGECLRRLLTHGYTGVWSLEPHLSLRPHETGFTRGRPQADPFMASAVGLQRLVDEEVVPAVGGWWNDGARLRKANP